MSWMLFFFWFAILLWAIIKLPFFKKSGIKPFAFAFVFSLKAIAGIGLTLVYTYYYPDRSTADIYKYFDDAQIIASTLPEHPQLYAEFITGINENDPKLEPYIKSMKNWSAHSEQWLSYTQTRDFNIFNSNRIVTRFNALLFPISMGNMFTHVLFMCFLSLIGLTALFRITIQTIREKHFPLFILIFCLPSVIFWCSGVLKDGLIISALYTALYLGFKKENQPLHNLFKWGMTGLLISLLLLTKYYVVLALIPGIIGIIILKIRPTIKPIYAHTLALMLCFFLIIAPSISGISPNGIDIIQAKREEALKAAILGDAKHYLFVDNMECSAWGFIRKIPEALCNGLFRPFIWEAGNSPFIALSALENLVLVFMFFGLIFFPDKKHYQNPKVWMFISFVFSLSIIIGFTTPISGGIVRYKTAFIPALCSVLVMLTDFSKVKLSVNISKRLNRISNAIFS